MNKRNNRFGVTGGVFFSCFLAAHPALAQIASDGSLPTEVTTPDQQNFTITGGNRIGNNLFHSFREFSVPTDGSATFEHAAQVENIFSRVTGGQVSNIDGLIRAQGSASLFLLNPNGIVFGPNARLDLGGSFIATTAERINFAEGGFFSAADPQAPLLSVNVPIGLQFGATPGSIVARTSAPREVRDGLRVQLRQTLALVGGDILVDEQARLIAPAGRVELGSVGSNSLVSLALVERGWDVGYQGVEDFQTLQINGSDITTSPIVLETLFSGERNGEIHFQARQVLISGETFVEGFNLGDRKGGEIFVNASESIEIHEGFFTTSSSGSGSAGDIRLNAPQVRLIFSSFSTFAENGQGGDIVIHAPEFVEIDGNGATSTLLTSSIFFGQRAGDVEIVTPRLILRDGGQINSSTRSFGNGGNVVIQVSEQVEISGVGSAEEFGGVVREVPSGIFSETQELLFLVGDATTGGDGGQITINTGRLLVRDGGEISVSAEGESAGRAGDLEINALDRVEIIGNGSSLQALSESAQPAGNLTVNTDELIVREGGQINVSATGVGTAGNLTVNAGSIRLAEQGLLNAQTRSGEGNINLQVDGDIILRSNSGITTDATEAASGGNIAIATDLLVLLENSSVTAQAIVGQGGDIAITAQSVFLSPDSTIDASSQLGIDGTVTIDTPEVETDVTVTDLPSDLIVPRLLAGCQAGASTAARLTNTGRGGLSPAPSETLSYSNIWEDVALPRRWSAADANPPAQLVEAKGWIVNEQGNVVLVSEIPPAASRGCWQSQRANGRG